MLKTFESGASTLCDSACCGRRPSHGNDKDVTPEAIAKAENKFVDSVFDGDGNLTDNYIVNADQDM
eukprot:SAG31_NODE_1153_length_9640_cov_2.830206_3_plen_66_part_00